MRETLSMRAARLLARTRLPGIAPRATRFLVERLTDGVADRLLPRQLALETTNHCNARCVMCPYIHMERTKGIMTWEIFEAVLKAVSDAGAPLQLITHAGLGDPLIDKRLADRIRREKEVFPSARTMIYTNAEILDERRARQLLEAGLDAVSVSFNGHRKETFEEVMKIDHARTKANVLRLLELRDTEFPKLTVNISCVPTDLHSREELREFREFWTGKADEVLVPDWIDWGHKIAGGEKPPTSQLPCRYLWSILLVNYDGTVIMCCEDYEQKYGVGNLARQSLHEVFNGPMMTGIRGRQRDGNFALPDICKGCLETSMRVVGPYWVKERGFDVVPRA